MEKETNPTNPADELINDLIKSALNLCKQHNLKDDTDTILKVTELLLSADVAITNLRTMNQLKEQGKTW